MWLAIFNRIEFRGEQNWEQLNPVTWIIQVVFALKIDELSQTEAGAGLWAKLLKNSYPVKDGSSS